jgi:hypothetical protein
MPMTVAADVSFNNKGVTQMVMRKSPRKHIDPNLEYVFDDTGKEVEVIRDHATMRVSLMVAMAARGQLTDAERHL